MHGRHLTYRTVATLLAQASLPSSGLDILGFLELANASVHGLRHVVIGGVLWLGNVEQLESELADAIGWAMHDTTMLAASTAGDGGIFYCPLVEAWDINNHRPAEGLSLVILQTDVCSCE